MRSNFGLTTAHWSLTWMNEQLVPAQKGLTQCYLPVTGPPSVCICHFCRSCGASQLKSRTTSKGCILYKQDCRLSLLLKLKFKVQGSIIMGGGTRAF